MQICFNDCQATRDRHPANPVWSKNYAEAGRPEKPGRKCGHTAGRIAGPEGEAADEREDHDTPYGTQGQPRTR